MCDVRLSVWDYISNLMLTFSLTWASTNRARRDHTTCTEHLTTIVTMGLYLCALQIAYISTKMGPREMSSDENCENSLNSFSFKRSFLTCISMRLCVYTPGKISCSTSTKVAVMKNSFKDPRILNFYPSVYEVAFFGYILYRKPTFQ